jgi:hypothetical protein
MAPVGIAGITLGQLESALLYLHLKINNGLGPVLNDKPRRMLKSSPSKPSGSTSESSYATGDMTGEALTDDF